MEVRPGELITENLPSIESVKTEQDEAKKYLNLGKDTEITIFRSP